MSNPRAIDNTELVIIEIQAHLRHLATAVQVLSSRVMGAPTVNQSDMLNVSAARLHLDRARHACARLLPWAEMGGDGKVGTNDGGLAG